VTLATSHIAAAAVEVSNPGVGAALDGLADDITLEIDTVVYAAEKVS